MIWTYVQINTSSVIGLCLFPILTLSKILTLKHVLRGARQVIPWTKHPMDKSSRGQVIRGQNITWTKHPVDKSSLDKTSHGQIIPLTSHPWTKHQMDKTSHRQNIPCYC